MGESGPARRPAPGGEGAAGRLRRLPRAAGDGLSAFWSGLAARTRQRLALALAAIVVLLLFFVAVMPVLPCSLPGGDECPPDDEAAEVVPADALAYVHANLDPETEQYELARDVAGRLPTITEQLFALALAQVPGPDGDPPDFERDIRPWFGGEVAIAVIPAGGRAAEQVQLIEVEDEQGAEEFAKASAAGKPKSEEHRGVEIQRDQNGLASALVGDFLVTGTDAGVRAVIDVETGAEEARALADAGDAQELADLLPEHRVAEAYLSGDGVDQLVGAGALASLEAFVNADAARAAGVALVADEGELELAMRSLLDPERAESNPGFFAAFPSFEGSLAAELDPGVLAYVGIGDPSAAFKELLAQADAEAPDLAAGFDRLSESLRDLGRINVERDLLPALGGEAAFVLALREGEEDEAAGGTGEDEVPGLPGEDTVTLGSQLDTPYLEALVSDVDESDARDALARLQGPIAEALQPEGDQDLQAPTFERDNVGQAQAQSLRLSPTVNLTYAIVDSMLAIATDPAGVEELVSGDGGLDQTEKFERATDELADEPALLAYLNLTDLVRLGEREGLAEDAAYAAFAPEVHRLDSLGLAVEQSDTELATDIRLLVEDSAEQEPSESPPGGGAASGSRGGGGPSVDDLSGD